LVVGGVVTSLLTLLAIARVWNRAFWRKPEDAEYPDPVLLTPGNVGVLPRTMVGSTAGLVAFGVALTVFAGPLFHLAYGSAEIMLDRTAYIQSVLGDSAEVPSVGQPGAAK
jgi:multicomponent Na+:H+ antiporter subunit D